MPWINVISNGDYGMVLSQAGSGYSWRTHASLNRITRWEQDLIRDEWGKYLYVRDAASGEFWSPTWQPCGAKLEEYRVRHGFGYSAIAARRGDLLSEVTYTVPLDAACELWIVQLRNQGSTPRRLQLFSYFEWGLGAAPDWHREFHRIFIETSYDAEHGALLANKVLWDLPGQQGPHWNRSWPYVAFHSASLPPGAATEVVFVLGAADDRAEALALAERFHDPAAAHAALAEVRQFWDALVGELAIDTPDPAFNLMANGWLQYQAIAGRLWGRTAYYQTGGAYGFRDQLQDSLIWLLVGRPEKTLEQIRLHAAHQYQDGVALHWWHPLAESGLRSGYSDDLLWLPFVTLYYIHETGDSACLRAE